MTIPPACLGCGAPLTRTWVDLGRQPLSNNFISLEDAGRAEAVYPLHARVCDVCLLVQVDSVVPPDAIFNKDYAYFSSFSDSWLAHCRGYVADMVERFELNAGSRVIEIASNDGYMLQYFVERGIPVLGIEPSLNTARAAEARGVRTETVFFGTATARDLAERGEAADLIAAKNVMAHVPDINDFVAGIPILLKPEGVFTVEFPHLLTTIEGVQFDTIYHEHFTYLSLLAVEVVFRRAGLRIFDVERLGTHGGSLRVFACRADAAHTRTARVETVRQAEIAAGLDRPEGYAGFDAKARRVRDDLLDFLRMAKAEGKTVIGYGAAAKGNTLLNYCGVDPGLLPLIVDLSPAKQNKLAPGSRVPVGTPQNLIEARPEYVLILPWNLRPEIERQMAGIRDWGGRFVVAIPALQIN
ncbi:class I SAM-dependent methyltransferase [Sphingosinicellaceae bacterium]|nr:class I SAM-dependent methyltransferase [Sphingosinicellaceae bacterium]